MGCRSQVGYVIQGKKEEIIPILMSYRLTYKDSAAAKEALDECTFTVNEDFVTIKFHADDIRWYQGYDHVDNHTALFNRFEAAVNHDESKDGSSISGVFARIGEDTTDIESLHFGDESYDMLHVVRELEFEVTADGNLESVLK